MLTILHCSFLLFQNVCGQKPFSHNRRSLTTITKHLHFNFMKFAPIKNFKLKSGKAIISLSVCAMAIAAFSFVSCNSGTKTASTSDTTKSVSTATTTDTASVKPLVPKGPNPAWGPNLKPEMAVVIEKLTSYGDKPIETLTAVEARKNHTPTDAVMAVMKEHNIPMPPSTVDTMGKEIPVAGGNIHIRIYTPKEGKAPFPVIVYYHGGGFVIANIDVYNASAQAMAE